MKLQVKWETRCTHKHKIKTGDKQTLKAMFYAPSDNRKITDLSISIDVICKIKRRSKFIVTITLE